MIDDARRRRSLFLTMVRGSMVARRGRLALAAAAIAIGTSVASALLLVSIDVGRKVERELRAYGPNLVLAPAAGELESGGRTLETGAIGGAPKFGHETYAWLGREYSQRRGIVGFTPMRYAVARAHGKTIVVVGTDFPGLTRVFYPSSGKSGLFETPHPLSEGWIGQRAAARLGVEEGDELQVELRAHGAVPSLTLARVDVLEARGPDDEQLFLPAARLDSVLGDPGRFHIALARVDGDAARVLAYAKEATARAPEGALPAGASLRPVTRLTEADGRMLHRIRLLLVLVSTVALVAAALCAMSTLADLVLERTAEIALLRSLGAGRGELTRLFLGEAALLGLAGGAAGLALGFVAAQAIGWGVFAASIRVAPIVPPVTLALGVAIALLASLAPLKDALAIEPARVLRGE